METKPPIMPPTPMPKPPDPNGTHHYPPGPTMPPTFLPPPKPRKTNAESTRETLAGWGKEKK